MLLFTVPAWNPSVLAFCLCQMIIAVLLLSGSTVNSKQWNINYIDYGVMRRTAITEQDDGIENCEKETKDPDTSDDNGDDECGDGDGDDDLRKRAEEFIERMNRVWRAEKKIYYN